MLNVLYISGSEEQSKYLDLCLEKHSSFCLTEGEKSFVKDLLLLISHYIDSVLIEEERSTITMARLLYHCVPDYNGESQLLCFVNYAIQNEDKSLDQNQINQLESLSARLSQANNHENVVVALQAILFDYMLNPESNASVSNLLNLAVLRCNFHNDTELKLLYERLCKREDTNSVFPEFSARYESLLNNYNQFDGKLLDYAYSKYESLPQHIKNKIEKYDFQICLSNELFGKSIDLRKLGSTHINDRKIRVWLENSKVSIDISFGHELGHVIDYVYGREGFISKTEKIWLIIFGADKDKYFKSKMRKDPELQILHEYAITNETEYFASAFADYIQCPKWLKKAAPDTYYYMETLLSE